MSEALMNVELHYDRGTLVIPQTSLPDEGLCQFFQLDRRTHVYRAPAYNYRSIVLYLRSRAIAYKDRAKKFNRLDVEMRSPIVPFPHQKQALAAWEKGGHRGIVELPTGSGKTFLAVLAIMKVKRPTLVVVPTIDLLVQWQRILETYFYVPIGVLGGGSRDLQVLTVTTYDSAALQTEFHGHRFGLLICDECHHLPAKGYQFIAAGSIAPYRLGLTATLARTDGGESVAMKLLGPVNFRIEIDQLEGDYLAPYEVQTVHVQLTEEEQAKYDQYRAEYIEFLRETGISLKEASGWGRFIAACHRDDRGREAFYAYRQQRRIALTSENKVEALWQILCRHRSDRILIFTDDNETVYRLSKKFMFPTITHQTKASERKQLLDQFAKGVLPVLLTSRVLNEGVDVPDANIGIVLSGSGSVREHVQRLGRILRKKPGKRAILYEVCTELTTEYHMSERRRQHRAYERANG